MTSENFLCKNNNYHYRGKYYEWKIIIKNEKYSTAFMCSDKVWIEF